MEAGSGGSFNMEADSGGSFQYGGGFRGLIYSWRRISDAFVLLRVYLRNVGGVSFNMEADVGGRFT
jgi:hypothetical protein